MCIPKENEKNKKKSHRYGIRAPARDRQRTKQHNDRQRTYILCIFIIYIIYCKYRDTYTYIYDNILSIYAVAAVLLRPPTLRNLPSVIYRPRIHYTM